MGREKGFIRGMRMAKMFLTAILLTVLAFWLIPMQGYASDQAIFKDYMPKQMSPRDYTLGTVSLQDYVLEQDTLQGYTSGAGDIWQDLRLNDAEEDFFGMFPEYRFDMEAIRTLIFEGKPAEAVSLLFKELMGLVKSQFDEIRNVFVMVLILGVVAALFSNFADVFNSHQVSELAFYFIYLLMIALLIRVFSDAASITRDILEQLRTFMQLFVPSYILAVGTASGLTSAAAYYQLFLGIVYLIENCYLALLMPLIYCFILLGVVNGIWMEEKLNLLLELIQKVINGGIKITLGIIMGFGMLQSLISPIVDSLEATALKKMISAIPGIGGLTESMFEMVAGSAVLIKNSIGIYITLVLLFVCALPILKILLMSGALKVGAALIGMVSDKRMTNCADRVGDGGLLLLKIALSSVALFIISIAIATTSTNRGM